nr:hypothetical protein [uncultured Solibaculum sp.]
MDQLVLIFSVAIIVEALLEYTKSVVYMFTRGCVKCGIIRICAAIIGVGLALLTGVNLFAEFNIPISQPWIGSVLTGIIISRGSNYLNDIISRLTNPTSAVSSSNSKGAKSVDSSTSPIAGSDSPVSSAVRGAVQLTTSSSENSGTYLTQQSSTASTKTEAQSSNPPSLLGPDDFPEAIEDTDLFGISSID